VNELGIHPTQPLPYWGGVLSPTSTDAAGTATTAVRGPRRTRTAPTCPPSGRG
jgi:hypothetical protein